MRIALLAVALLVAGCLAGTGQDDPSLTPPERPVMPEDPMTHETGHDHSDANAHKFLWNLELLSHDPMRIDPVNAAGLHALAQADGYLYGAVWGSRAASTDGGMVVWSLEDPDQPREVGRLTLPGTVGGDRSIGVTPDGRYVILAAEALTCFGQVNPLASNAYLIDVSDKANPIIVDTVTKTGSSTGSPTRTATNPFGYHSVTVVEIGDKEWAFLFGEVWQIERAGPTGARLVHAGASLQLGHDLFVRVTPWGDIWGLAANGDRNLQVWDLSDPTTPREIAFWDLPDRGAVRQTDGVRHYFHTADAAFFPDGQVLIMVNSEDVGDHVSPLWILDATALKDHAGDPIELEWIGTWNNPGDHPAGAVTFSLHNPRWADDGILTITHYHGGLWQLDFRDPAWRAEPAEIAYAVYAEGPVPAIADPQQDLVSRELCNIGVEIEAPSYMDVELGPEGRLYVADPFTGLYTFGPGADHPWR